MSIVGRVVASVLGAGTCSVVGCYAGGVFGKGSPSYNLTQDNDSKYNSETIGREYGMYLVGTQNSKNEAGGRNKYKEYKKDKQDSKVHISVSSDYSSNVNDQKSLNGFCNNLYTKYLGHGDGEINFDYEIEDPLSGISILKYQGAGFILKYCSPLGTRPTAIQQEDNKYDKNVISSDKDIEKLKLVKTKDDANKTFWQLQQQWFKALDKNKLDDYFKKFFKEGNNKSIKDICAEAYESEERKDEADTTKPKLEDVIKYCSFIKPNIQIIKKNS